MFLLILSCVFTLAAGGVALPGSIGLGDVSNTSWNQDVPLTPSVVTNNLNTEGIAGKQDGVYFGSGNANGFWSLSDAADGVQVAVRVTNRYGGNVFDATSGGDSEFSGVGAIELEADEGMKIDYSITVLPTSSFNNLGQVISAGGRFEIAIDIDPSDNVDFASYDPASFPERGGTVPLTAPPDNPGFVQTDHAFLSEDRTEVYGGLSAGVQADMDMYLTERNRASGLQNSMQPIFGAIFPPSTPNAMGNFLGANGSVDPDATGFAIGAPIVFPSGRYEVYLIYTDGSGVQARSAISVFMRPTTSNGGSDNPSTLPPMMSTE